MNKLPISAFMICFNEEARIRKCIESLHLLAEIVVVDSGSTDQTIHTLKMLQDAGAPIKLFQRDWLGYSKQKQFALEQCKHPWCFNIDADERLDVALQNELEKLVKAGHDVVGWKIARRPFLPGYKYPPAHVHERRVLRLIRNGLGQYDTSLKVHEALIPEGKVMPCKRGALLHYTPINIGDQILKENTYSTLKSEMITESKKYRTPWRMVYNPPTYFLRLFFRNGLWRCGFPGFIQAVIGAMYSFLTEAKVYQARRAKRNDARDDEII